MGTGDLVLRRAHELGQNGVRLQAEQLEKADREECK